MYEEPHTSPKQLIRLMRILVNRPSVEMAKRLWPIMNRSCTVQCMTSSCPMLVLGPTRCFLSTVVSEIDSELSGCRVRTDNDLARFVLLCIEKIAAWEEKNEKGR